MSTAPVLLLQGGRLVHELDAQAASLPGPATRVVITCDEPRASGAPPWEQRMTDALFLRTAGADIYGPGVREAVLHAVHTLGARHVVVVAHSRCSHIDAKDPSPRVSGHGPIPLMDRIYSAMERNREQLAATREQVRAAVADLTADPEIGGADVAVSGLVEIVEAGTLTLYEPERDTFEAML